jgi:hypothetical protein
MIIFVGSWRIDIPKVDIKLAFEPWNMLRVMQPETEYPNEAVSLPFGVGLCT